MLLKILYTIQLLDAFCMSLIIPLINLRITTLGGSLLVVGIISSVSSGAQLFGSPVIGSWSDKRGRKSMLIYTLLVTLLSNILVGIPSLPLFFLSRVLYGVSHQTDVLLGAIISDKVPPQEVSAAFGKLGAIIGSAFMVGPVLSGVLYETFESFYLISIILCTTNVALIIICQLNLSESVKPKETKNDEVEQSFVKSVTNDLGKVFKDLKSIDWEKYGDVLMIKLSAEAVFAAMFMNMGVILIEKFAFRQIDVGLVFSIVSVIMVSTSLSTSFIFKVLYKSDNTGSSRTFHSSVMLLASVSSFLFASSSLIYLTCICSAVVAKTMLDAVLMEILTGRTTETDKGVVLGANTSMMALSGLICPLISGVVGSFLGINYLILLPIIPSLAGTLLINYTKKSVNKDKELYLKFLLVASLIILNHNVSKKNSRRVLLGDPS